MIKSEENAQGRALSVPALIGVVVVYLIIIQGVGQLLNAGSGVAYGDLPSLTQMVRQMLIPVGLSVLFAMAVIWWLGWWDKVLHEKIRLGRWAWLFPGGMVLSTLVVTNYPQLGEAGAAMSLALLVGVLLVGVGECLMYRGIALESLRRVKGTTEMRAALWAAVIFGASHLSNILTEGPGAFGQMLLAAVLGLLLYIALRVSGGLLVPILVHAAWDFGLFSTNLGVDPDPYTLSVLATVTTIILFVILIVRRHKIWPPSTVAAT